WGPCESDHICILNDGETASGHATAGNPPDDTAKTRALLAHLSFKPRITAHPHAPRYRGYCNRFAYRDHRQRRGKHGPVASCQSDLARKCLETRCSDLDLIDTWRQPREIKLPLRVRLRPALLPGSGLADRHSGLNSRPGRVCYRSGYRCQPVDGPAIMFHREADRAHARLVQYPALTNLSHGFEIVGRVESLIGTRAPDHVSGMGIPGCVFDPHGGCPRIAKFRLRQILVLLVRPVQPCARLINETCLIPPGEFSEFRLRHAPPDFGLEPIRIHHLGRREKRARDSVPLLRSRLRYRLDH